MTTKRPDNFEEFQRKQAAKRALLPPISHNTPDLPSLSHDEIVHVETARSALLSLKKSFELWIGIARGLKTLRDKADRLGGRFTFDRLREREGLGKDVFDESRVSRLLAILEREREVVEWRAKKLTDKQRFEWASPEAITRHCPVFAKPKIDGEAKLSPYAQMKQANITLQEENEMLKQREDGDRFKPTDTSDDIATVLVGMFSKEKARDIANRVLAKLKERKP
jgi:hypothetical protein